MPSGDGGLGVALIGEKIDVNGRNVAVTKLLGEGGFSYVYLVKELGENGQPLQPSGHGGSDGKDAKNKRGGDMVLKVTSIHSRAQRDIAEKEAKLLSRLSHPSIIKMYDTCYRQTGNTNSGGFLSKDSGSSKPQHVILMEYCEGGHALDVCNKLAAAGKRFDLSTLIIAFGQICNAVSYLHAQRPPIVHRDLKPVNFLVKNGAYKLCDFGSAVFGHVDLTTQKARVEAEECIEKTTTQMFRAPEMIDLYSTKRLTQATDVWALGCCLYSLAFLQNCFEEGSNLAILSRKYKIPDGPDGNPYGDGLVELLDRMLTVDPKARSDMTEVILCLSAVYSGRPLPPRKKSSKPKKEPEPDEAKKPTRPDRASGGGADDKAKAKKKKEKAPEERVGTFRTDGQGIYGDGLGPGQKKVKKLNPNSAAARRRQQAGVVPTQTSTNNGAESANAEGDLGFTAFDDTFGHQTEQEKGNQDLAFSTASNPFAAVSSEAKETNDTSTPVNDGNQIFDAFASTPMAAQADASAFASFDQPWGDVGNSATAAESANMEGFGEFDAANAPLGSQKGEASRKPRSRRSRSKTRQESTGENLEDSLGEMNVSGDGHSGEPRRRQSTGERKSGTRTKGERARRPKEPEDPNAPQRRTRDPEDPARPRRSRSKGTS